MDNNQHCKSVLFEHKITNNVAKDISKKINKLIIKGLEKKGYFFKDKNQLISFIEKNCKAKLTLSNHKVLYVIEEPFLCIDLNTLFNTESVKDSNKLTISIKIQYKFL